MEDRNKLLMSQLIAVRRECDAKDSQYDQIEKRLANSEKLLAVAKQQLHQALVAAKTQPQFGGMMPFTTPSGQL